MQADNASPSDSFNPPSPAERGHPAELKQLCSVPLVDGTGVCELRPRPALPGATSDVEVAAGRVDERGEGGVEELRKPAGGGVDEVERVEEERTECWGSSEGDGCVELGEDATRRADVEAEVADLGEGEVGAQTGGGGGQRLEGRGSGQGERETEEKRKGLRNV